MENDNTGVLFKNEKKREGKHDADYQGNITIDGRDYWLNAWINTSKDGTKKYMALKARIKDGTKSTVEEIVNETKKQFPSAKILNDEIPF